MRTRRRIETAAVGILAAALCSVCLPAQAADTTLGLDLNSAYIWRGITVNDGLVAQPSLDVALPAGFGVNVWANMDLSDDHGKFDNGEFSEVDMTANYTLTKGPFEFSAGLIEYLFPHQTEVSEDDRGRALPGTRELFAGVTMDVGAGFSVGVEGFYDIDEVDDFYAYVDVGYELPIVEDTLTATADVSAGAAGSDWAAYYAGGTDGGLNEVEVGVGLKYAPAKALELSAKVAYTDSLDKDVLPDQDTHWYGGVSAAYTF